MALKRLAILGSTGSIGVTALGVVEERPERFKVVSLAAASSFQKLAGQVLRHKPLLAAVKDQAVAQKLREILPADCPTRVVHGPEGYLAATLEAEADLVVSAMVGAAGLMPTFAAVQAGINVALANKESLVAAGELVMQKAQETGANILPVDSEHSALFQALQGRDPGEVRRLWLTASGGPFRDLSLAGQKDVTPKMALNHPRWSMGPKITVDSATLMNKGLEVIEARWLFNRPLSEIKVVIHPQSLVHALVEMVDGSLIAQLAEPDMRLPIAYALSYPQRLRDSRPGLNPAAMGELSFAAPDLARFRTLALAYAAAEQGGTAPAVLSGANEVAVESFLKGLLDFPGIPALVEAVLDRHRVQPADTVAAVLEADRWARGEARNWLEKR